MAIMGNAMAPCQIGAAAPLADSLSPVCYLDLETSASGPQQVISPRPYHELDLATSSSLPPSTKRSRDESEDADPDSSHESKRLKLESCEPALHSYQENAIIPVETELFNGLVDISITQTFTAPYYSLLDYHNPSSVTVPLDPESFFFSNEVSFDSPLSSTSGPSLSEEPAAAPEHQAEHQPELPTSTSVDVSFADDPDAEGEDDDEFINITPYPPRQPRVELNPYRANMKLQKQDTGIWKSVCQMRFRHIERMYSMEKIRLRVAREAFEASLWPLSSPSVQPTPTTPLPVIDLTVSSALDVSAETTSEAQGEATSLLNSGSQTTEQEALHLEIYTPSNFNDNGVESQQDVKSLEGEQDVVMHPADEDDDTDDDSDEDDSDDDEEDEWDKDEEEDEDLDLESVISPHETVVSFPSIPPSSTGSGSDPSATSYIQPQMLVPANGSAVALQEPPSLSHQRLPGISQIDPYDWIDPDYVYHGTPARPPPIWWVTGSLLELQVSRIATPPPS